MGNIHTVGPNEALIVSVDCGRLRRNSGRHHAHIRHAQTLHAVHAKIGCYDRQRIAGRSHAAAAQLLHRLHVPIRAEVAGIDLERTVRIDAAQLQVSARFRMQQHHASRPLIVAQRFQRAVHLVVDGRLDAFALAQTQSAVGDERTGGENDRDIRHARFGGSVLGAHETDGLHTARDGQGALAPEVITERTQLEAAVRQQRLPGFVQHERQPIEDGTVDERLTHREIAHERQVKVLQMLPRSDAGQQQQLGGVDVARRYDHLLACAHFVVAEVSRVRHTVGRMCVGVDQYLQHLAVGLDVQVGPFVEHRFNERTVRGLAHAAQPRRLDVRDAELRFAVVVELAVAGFSGPVHEGARQIGAERWKLDVQLTALTVVGGIFQTSQLRPFGFEKVREEIGM
uniref:Uncharacterized protein n=1 Tax=Anopheles coluzzii TaxID=1518534 RepID=A0A8W7PNA6_ANOCL